MPTYTYKILETGETFEVKQSMRDEPLNTHPETGQAVKRLLSKPAIAFKGSGFYATDSRGGAGKGGESKPAAKADAAPAATPKADAPKASAPAPKAGE